MTGADLFHRARRKAVAGDIDDVVGARHDEDIAVIVYVTGIRCLVIAGEFREAGGAKPFVGIPEARQAARREGELDGDIAKRTGRHLMARIVEHMEIVARHGHGGRTVFHGQHIEAERIADDRPSGLRLPPVIDDGNAEHGFGPAQRIGVGPLAGQEQRPQTGEIVVLHKHSFGILLANGAEGRRRREEHGDLVLLHHPPEGAGIRRADRLALIEHRRAAVQQRRIDDVGMADDPADIRRRPIDLTGFHAVERPHGPGERDHMAAIVADDTLRLARRA